MKKSTSLVAVLVFLIQNTFVQTSHCDLVSDTCKKTPHPALCVSILRADSRTEGSDVDGFAFIMVGEVEVKASDVLQKIGHLRKNKPLSDCQGYYVAVVQNNVPQAENAIDGGDGGKGEQLMNDVIGKADSCERGFKGSSPLTSLNIAVKDVSSVAAALARLM